jgi:hypothetical protein
MSNSRKRPNKAQILETMKKNDKKDCNSLTTLKGLEVKNALQRVYNRTMDKQLSKAECTKLQNAMKTFLSEVDEVIPRK